MKIYLNVESFEDLQSGISNIAMAKKLKISRCQLWRAKSGKAIGEKFIAEFKRAFPKYSIDKFFSVKR